MRVKPTAYGDGSRFSTYNGGGVLGLRKRFLHIADSVEPRAFLLGTFRRFLPLLGLPLRGAFMSDLTSRTQSLRRKKATVRPPVCYGAVKDDSGGGGKAFTSSRVCVVSFGRKREAADSFQSCTSATTDSSLSKGSRWTWMACPRSTISVKLSTRGLRSFACKTTGGGGGCGLACPSDGPVSRYCRWKWRPPGSQTSFRLSPRLSESCFPDLFRATNPISFLGIPPAITVDAF